jgi:hypothetical protein
VDRSRRSIISTRPGRAQVIVEERIYTLQPGKIPEYMARFEREGSKIYLDSLKNVIGVFSTETGVLNQVVTIVAYNSFEERVALRSRMKANPEWEAYASGVRPFVLRQENRLYTPAPFSPLR